MGTNPVKTLLSFFLQRRLLKHSRRDRVARREEDSSADGAQAVKARLYLPFVRSPSDQLQVVVIKPPH
jgi:hypothetical protein